MKNNVFPPSCASSGIGPLYQPAPPHTLRPWYTRLTVICQALSGPSASVQAFSCCGVSHNVGTGRTSSTAFWLIEHVKSATSRELEKPLQLQVSGSVQEKKNGKRGKAPWACRCCIHDFLFLSSTSSPVPFATFFFIRRIIDYKQWCQKNAAYS